MFLIHADGYRKRNFSLSLSITSLRLRKKIFWLISRIKTEFHHHYHYHHSLQWILFLRKVMVQLEVVLIIIKNKNKADPKRTDQNMYGYFSKSYIFSIYTVNVVHIRITSVFNCSKNAHIINESSTMVLCCW